MIYFQFRENLIESLTSDKKLLVGSHVFEVMAQSLYDLLYTEGDKIQKKDTYELYYDNFMHYLSYSELVKSHFESLKNEYLEKKRDGNAKDKYFEFMKSIKDQ